MLLHKDNVRLAAFARCEQSCFELRLESNVHAALVCFRRRGTALASATTLASILRAAPPRSSLTE